MGTQLIRSADSVAANLAEGFGRYHFGEQLNFTYFARGSLFETRVWLEKAANRNLISSEHLQAELQKITLLGKMLNSYLKSIKKIRTTTKR